MEITFENLLAVAENLANSGVITAQKFLELYNSGNYDTIDYENQGWWLCKKEGRSLLELGSVYLDDSNEIVCSVRDNLEDLKCRIDGKEYNLGTSIPVTRIVYVQPKVESGELKYDESNYIERVYFGEYSSLKLTMHDYRENSEKE